MKVQVVFVIRGQEGQHQRRIWHSRGRCSGGQARRLAYTEYKAIVMDGKKGPFVTSTFNWRIAQRRAHDRRVRLVDRVK